MAIKGNEGRRALNGGFGQSFVDDIWFIWRFNRCRRKVVVWRVPTGNEIAAQANHQIISRFGDEAIAVAEVACQRWIVRERDFYGWPDPPRYVFFALEGDQIWSAKDFAVWPGAWSAPMRG